MQQFIKDKISVAMCTYNGEAYLSYQLDSIFSQSMSVDEVIICDDMSSDKTEEIIESYKSRFPNIIRFYSNTEKLFTVKNFEKAIGLTTGEFIFIADQDDVWNFNKVEATINFLKNDEDAELLFTNAELIDENSKAIAGNLWDKFNFSKTLQQQWLNKENQIVALIQNFNKATGATICIRAKLKKDILPMNLPYAVWHDCYMCLMAAKNNGLRFLDEKLIKYRIHNKQQVGLGTISQKRNKYMVSYQTYRVVLEKHFKQYVHYFDAKYRLTEVKRTNHFFYLINNVFLKLKRLLSYAKN